MTQFIPLEIWKRHPEQIGIGKFHSVWWSICWQCRCLGKNWMILSGITKVWLLVLFPLIIWVEKNFRIYWWNRIYETQFSQGHGMSQFLIRLVMHKNSRIWFDLIWFGLLHINCCGLFYAKSSLYIFINVEDLVWLDFIE